MNIDLREHLELVHGMLEAVPTGRGLWLRRLTEEAAALFAINEPRTIRCNCSAGVRICFRSYTRVVTLRLALGRREGWGVFTTDVSIDDGPVLTFGAEAAGNDYDVRVEAPGPGEHRYEIHLPHLCESEVLSLEVDDGATVSPVSFPGTRVAFIGDSITQGMTSSSPARCYAARLAKALGRDFVNLAVGGGTMLAGMGQAALAYEWGTAYVAFGVNDWAGLRPLEEFAEATRGMLRGLASRAGAEIRIITPIPFVRPIETPHPTPLDAFRDCIRAVAREFPGVQVIDGLTLMPADPALFSDGLHPNDGGMRAMAESLAKR